MAPLDVEDPQTASSPIALRLIYDLAPSRFARDPRPTIRTVEAAIGETQALHDWAWIARDPSIAVRLARHARDRPDEPFPPIDYGPVARGPYVVRVSYNSPLEIIVAFSAAFAGSVGAITAMLAMIEKAGTLRLRIKVETQRLEAERAKYAAEELDALEYLVTHHVRARVHPKDLLTLTPTELAEAADATPLRRFASSAELQHIDEKPAM